MKTSVLVSALLLALAPSIQAHEGHAHEEAAEVAPHGGTLRNAGDFKAEIVINGDNVKLYIYDKQLKAVKLDKAEFSGNVQFPKEKSKPIVWKRNGEFYETSVKGISKVHRYDMHVNVEAAGKKALADFGVDNI